MSKSLPKPWLRDWGLELLQECGKIEQQSSGKAHKKFKASRLKSRMVQVTGVDAEMNLLTINDKSTTVTAMLTKGCVEEILNDYESLEELRNSVVTLSGGSYHMSTVYQCAGTRDVKKMRGGKGFSLPLAIQVSNLSQTGATDLEIFTDDAGNMPTDLNHTKEVRDALKELTYVCK